MVESTLDGPTSTIRRTLASLRSSSCVSILAVDQLVFLYRKQEFFNVPSHWKGKLVPVKQLVLIDLHFISYLREKLDKQCSCQLSIRSACVACHFEHEVLVE